MRFPTGAAMVTPSATVVVVNFNGGEEVLRCLEGLAAQTVRPRSILVLDNASSDGSADACERLARSDARLAGITSVERAEVNRGFAAACNRGFEASSDDLVALLNPDAFPEPGWLGALVDAAGRHPDCVAFGSRQMLAGRPGIVDGLGDCYHVSGLAWRRGHGRPLRPGDLRERAIFSPCAAAALYRRAAVMEVGGFDEDFFCYFEDVDLGFRLRLAGGHAMLVPDAVVHHVGGGSSGGGRGAMATYHGHRNLVWTALKNMPRPLIPLFLLAQPPQTIMTFVVCASRGQAAAFLRAKRDAVRGIPACLRKRGVTRQRRRASAWSIWKSFSSGWRPDRE